MDIQAVHLELVTDLREWCQGEDLKEDHTLLALVPKGIEVSQIEEALETVKVLGRVRVRGRKYKVKLDCVVVLCECKEKIDPSKVPAEVMPPNATTSWPIITAGAEEGASSIFGGLLGSSTHPSSAETIIRAVGYVLSKVERPSGDNSSYRRLHVFSGTLPTPVGEETFEHWLEQARLIVEESECSDKEKRRRIMECLRGPALSLVKAIRTAKSDVSLSKCLDGIESAFGTTESGEDLYFEFRSLQQEKHEKLSDFV